VCWAAVQAGWHHVKLPFVYGSSARQQGPPLSEKSQRPDISCKRAPCTTHRTSPCSSLQTTSFFATMGSPAHSLKNRLGPAHPNQSSCSQLNMCQVQGCNQSIASMKGYYRKRRVCPDCSRAESVLLDGHLELGPQRFCQQCGKFHPVEDFDTEYRNCRASLRKRKQLQLRGQQQGWEVQDQQLGEQGGHRREQLEVVAGGWG